MTHVQSIGVQVEEGIWKARLLITVFGKRRVRYAKRKFRAQQTAVDYGMRIEKRCSTRVDDLDDTAR